MLVIDFEKGMKENGTTTALMELIRAGLWERDAQLLPYGEIDYTAIYNIAETQGVVGLVVAGLEHVTDVKIPQMAALTFAGSTIQMEQRNKAMNGFIAELVKKMRVADIYTMLVKGQGVAQCYERPLWRPSGDVDFLLSDNNYQKAKAFLLPLSSGNKHEERYSQHLGINIGQWYVEIHGTLRTGLAARVDREVDAVIRRLFYGGNVRSWMNGGTQVFLPVPNEDVFLVFTHFIKHFYKEGMTLRQVCDWCRLMWTYQEQIDAEWMEKHVNKAGLMGEWKAFYNLACKYLGMPDLDSRLMSQDSSFDKKAEKLMAFILGGYSGNKVKDTWQIAKIFSWKTLRYAPSIFLNVNWLKVRERVFGRK